jgi:hypothetical protein
MGKPTNITRGFIEVSGHAGKVLLSLQNIAGVSAQGDKAYITLITRVDAFSAYSNAGLVSQSYESVIEMIREAA